MFKSLKWEDWLGVGLGVWLLASPFVLGFSDATAPTLNALVMGCVLVLEEMLELGVHESAEEWIDLAAGTWLVVSPAVLGFSGQMAASISTIAVGLLTLLFAALALSSVDDRLGSWWQHQRARH